MCICKYIMLKKLRESTTTKCQNAWRGKNDLSARMTFPAPSPVSKNTPASAKSDGLKGPFGVPAFRSNRNPHAAIFPLTVHNTIMARVYGRVATNRNVYMCIYRPIPPSPPSQKIKRVFRLKTVSIFRFSIVY